MDFFKELMRIGETMESSKDRAILFAAAVKLAPGPIPDYEATQRIPGFGIHHISVYGKKN